MKVVGIRIGCSLFAAVASQVLTDNVVAGMTAGILSFVLFAAADSFLFGATDKLVELEHDVPRLPKVVILRLRNMTAIDGTGLHALEHFADVLHASGRALILCGMRDQPARMMERAEFHQHLGDENLAPTIEAALRRARGVLRADDDRRIQAM